MLTPWDPFFKSVLESIRYNNVVMVATFVQVLRLPIPTTMPNKWQKADNVRPTELQTSLVGWQEDVSMDGSEISEIIWICNQIPPTVHMSASVGIQLRTSVLDVPTINLSSMSVTQCCDIMSRDNVDIRQTCGYGRPHLRLNKMLSWLGRTATVLWDSNDGRQCSRRNCNVMMLMVTGASTHHCLTTLTAKQNNVTCQAE